MASEAAFEFTDDNFQAEVLESDVPVLVDYWAEWCMPCKMLAPTVDRLADEYKGRAKIGKLDTDANRDATLKYQINAIPTLILFHNGEVAKKFVGMTKEEDMREALDGLLAGSAG